MDEQPGTRAGAAGPPVRARKLPVPDVTGLPRPVAAKVLASAGFPPARVRFVESYGASDVVVGQAPERGTLRDADEPIALSVSRQSWIRHLPSVYRPKRADDPSFLREFLWIFQQVMDSVGTRIDSVPDLFRPSTTPPDFLPWLASWFAISFDESMSDAHRRRILREAPGLFAIRGTRDALVRLVWLFTGLDVTIEENRWPYRGFRIGVASSVGVDTMILPEISMSQTFVVRVPRTYEEVGGDLLLRLHRVIQAEKPANSNYFLQFADVEGVTEAVGMRIGVGAMIGIEADGEDGGFAGAGDAGDGTVTGTEGTKADGSPD